MNFIFIVTFFIIALLYSSIGFGGGSSYIAFMLLFNLPYDSIPLIALSCNLIVVSGGSFHYLKNKQVSLSFIFPFLMTSIPAAYFGGMIEIEKEVFRLILGACLLLAALRMISNTKKDYEKTSEPSTILSGVVGLILGGISGMVGIGGGIFLSPLMYNLRWGRPKQIAATCSLFIFFNSIAGLIGQFQKSVSILALESYWPLLIAVFIGGQIGSYVGSNKLKPRYIEIITSILVMIVSVRVLVFS